MCKYGVFPIKHPQVYYKDDIPDRVQGLLKCKILPPARLFHPLLPARVNGKLVFPLCRTCAEEGTKDSKIGDCTHSDEERAMIGTWVSLEIDKALSLGYTILEKYSAWHYEEVSQYDVEKDAGGIWAHYTNLWLKLKQEASGYPAWCETREDKEQYISDYKKHEGISLDRKKIEKNEGLRSLSKLMLNRLVFNVCLVFVYFDTCII